MNTVLDGLIIFTIIFVLSGVFISLYVSWLIYTKEYDIYHFDEINTQEYDKPINDNEHNIKFHKKKITPMLGKKTLYITIILSILPLTYFSGIYNTIPKIIIPILYITIGIVVFAVVLVIWKQLRISNKNDNGIDYLDDPTKSLNLDGWGNTRAASQVLVLVVILFGAMHVIIASIGYDISYIIPTSLAIISALTVLIKKNV